MTFDFFMVFFIPTSFLWTSSAYKQSEISNPTSNITHIYNMNPNESPPSFSSGAIRTIDQEPVDVGTIPNAEPSTGNNQGPSFTNLYPGQGRSINEPFKGDSYEYEDKAPSVGAMRQFIASTTSGGTMYLYSDNQPPSLNDVARRDASQTGSSYTGDEGSVPQPGMSLTGKNFNKYHPGAYHKDD